MVVGSIPISDAMDILKATKYLFFSAVVSLLFFLSGCNGETTDETLLTDPKSTPTPAFTATPTPSPTATLTPLMASLTSELMCADTTDEGVKIIAAAADFLTSYYSGAYDSFSKYIPEDMLMERESYEALTGDVASISYIRCYYKKGIDYADYIVYVLYDMLYKNNSVKVPSISEFCMSFKEDGSAVIYPLISSESVEEAVLKSRLTDDVLNLYIRQTIDKYLCAMVSGNREALSETVSDGALIDFESIAASNQFIDSYTTHEMHVNAAPENIKDVDYVVYITEDIKFININTPAPGASEYLIKLNDENIPRIFFGDTSEETDAFRAALKNSEEYGQMIDEITAKLQEVLTSDPELSDFVKHIYGD